MKRFPLLLCLVSFLCPSCVQTTSSPLWISRVQGGAPSSRAEEIFRLPRGEKISFDELLSDIGGARVIFVGEVHDQIEHHQIQVRILQSLLQGKEVAVGMEMFQRSQQPILDRWSLGLLTEEEFLKEIQWERTWGMDYGLYRDLLNTVKGHRLRLFGLNIERDLVRKVAEKGIDRLSPEDKERLPEMDLSDHQHRAYIASIFKGHQEGEAKDLESFYQAQVLWDEAMAESLSTFLSSPEGHGKTILVLAGNGHIIFNFGIPKRFARRSLLPFRTIVLKPWEKDLNRDLILPGVASPLADYLWITRPTPHEKRRPRVGLFLKENADLGNIEIERVIPGSPAEKAGLLPGDQIVAIEGKEIKRMSDMHHAFTEKGWRKEITFTIVRNGIIMGKTITFPSVKPSINGP